MKETRLYHKRSDQYTYERFETEDIANDEAQLRKFVFLLGVRAVIPEKGPVPLHRATQRTPRLSGGS